MDYHPGVMQTQKLSTSPNDLDKAAELLMAGQVVALPTETVYGLAGVATQEQALLRIFESKERPLFDPLIVHLPENYSPCLDQVVDLDQLSEQERNWAAKLAAHFWPGPLTLVLPKRPLIPDLATSGLKHVAVRVPKHPVFQALLGRLPEPWLAAPSANRFGRISPTSASAVMTELAGRIPAVVDGGECTVGVESTVIHIEKNAIYCLRPGGLPLQAIEEKLGHSVIRKNLVALSNQLHVSPGQLENHYAPRKPLSLVAFGGLPEKIDSKAGVILYHDLSKTEDSHEAARNLFRILRELDEHSPFDRLIAELPPNQEGLNLAIEDRLQRAARSSSSTKP